MKPDVVPSATPELLWWNRRDLTGELQAGEGPFSVKLQTEWTGAEE